MECVLWAQGADRIRFNRLGVADGLVSNDITCFLRDRKGFLWVGTNSGLNRFDGYEFRRYAKPFNMEMLLLKVSHLLETRRKMQQSFLQKNTTGIALTEVEISSLDEELMRKAISYIETQIGSPELTVERLSREMGMSRVNFYKKCLSITGKSPVELIRVIRLKRAAQLLEKSQLRVGEVALECGFNDVKLFRKYFKEEFGVPPSDYPRA